MLAEFLVHLFLGGFAGLLLSGVRVSGTNFLWDLFWTLDLDGMSAQGVAVVSLLLINSTIFICKLGYGCTSTPHRLQWEV